MSVFLIQTNGRDIHEAAQPEYIQGANGPTFVDESLHHQWYYNAAPYWTREGYGPRDAWETVTGETYKTLLYESTGHMSSRGKTELRKRLYHIDPYEFEHFISDLWAREGWETTVSQAANDRGVDVIAEQHGTISQKLAIQAKRYGEDNKVGRPKVQQYYALKEQDTEADAAVVVTTSAFTKDARLWANEHNVKLVDGADLIEMIQRLGATDLVDENAPALAEIETQSGTGTTGTTDSEAATTTMESTVSERDPYQYVRAALWAWGFAFLFAYAYSNGASELVGLIGGISTLAGFFLAPYGIYHDIRENFEAGWFGHLFWVIVGLFPLLGVAAYAYLRPDV